MAQTRAFAITGSALWNQHPPSTRSTLLTDSQVPLFVLLRLLSSPWVARTGSASDWCALQEALYKYIDTIQYNTIGRMSCIGLQNLRRRNFNVSMRHIKHRLSFLAFPCVIRKVVVHEKSVQLLSLLRERRNF